MKIKLSIGVAISILVLLTNETIGTQNDYHTGKLFGHRFGQLTTTRSSVHYQVKKIDFSKKSAAIGTQIVIKENGFFF